MVYIEIGTNAGSGGLFFRHNWLCKFASNCSTYCIKCIHLYCTDVLVDGGRNFKQCPTLTLTHV